MNEFLNDHTNQTDALASIAESLSAISICTLYITLILAGLLVFKWIKWFSAKD